MGLNKNHVPSGLSVLVMMVVLGCLDMLVYHIQKNLKDMIPNKIVFKVRENSRDFLEKLFGYSLVAN